MSLQSTTNYAALINHCLYPDCTLKNVIHPIVFYDGVCGLCNRLVQFLLNHDRKDRLRFAALQSEFAARVLGRHGIDPTDLDTVHVVVNFDEPNERVLNRSTAVLRAARELGGIWSVAALLGMLVPRPLRNFFYGLVATNRYRMFGKYETCMLPSPAQRAKFLDLN
jgi:predicted DCC family thiol-disulfide oxidoreductase YuxK